MQAMVHHRFGSASEVLQVGVLRPGVDHTVHFQDAGFAVDDVETGSLRGKIAISGVQ